MPSRWGAIAAVEGESETPMAEPPGRAAPYLVVALIAAFILMFVAILVLVTTGSAA